MVAVFTTLIFLLRADHARNEGSRVYQYTARTSRGDFRVVFAPALVLHDCVQRKLRVEFHLTRIPVLQTRRMWRQGIELFHELPADTIDDFLDHTCGTMSGMSWPTRSAPRARAKRGENVSK